jgi:hypothetical protein
VRFVTNFSGEAADYSFRLHPSSGGRPYMRHQREVKMTPFRHHAFVAAMLFAVKALKKGEKK